MEIGEVLDQLGIDHVGNEHRHGRSGWRNIDCPFCDDGSRKKHLGINEQRLSATCWNCGPHYLPKALSLACDRPIDAVLELIRGVDATYRKIVRETGTYKEPPMISETLSERHKQYLQRRFRKSRWNIQELISLWDIRSIGFAKRCKWSLFIPIHHNGKPVSWTSRSIQKDVRARYISASPQEESISHKEILYGEDYVRHSVIVHEGPLDVWATGPGAVATLGTSFTSNQVERIARFPYRYVCFDTSPEAQQRANQLCNQLAPFPGTTSNVTLDAEDAAEAHFDELQELRSLIG